MSKASERTAMAGRLADLIDTPELRALCRTLVGGHYERVRPGLPRLVDRSAAARYFRGSDVLIELLRPPVDGLRGMAIVLSSASGAALVDRLLGGHGEIPGALSLTEAECGVLAYGAARVLSLVAPQHVLGDVRSEPRAALIERACDHILWPVTLEGPLGQLELRIIVSEASARELPLSLELELCLFDRAEVGALDGLIPGAVLASDAWSLTVTARGLSGAVELFVPDTNARFSATLEAGSVHARADSEHAEPDARELRVRLARRRVGLAELAAIVAGGASAFAALSGEPVTLVHGGRVLGEGELASHRGSLCVRLTRCGSAASPEPLPA